MNINDSLAAYANSQQHVAIAFLALGAVLIASSVVFFLLSDPSSLLQGFKIGALICGMLISVGGGSYLFANSSTHDKLTAEYESNPREFVGSEQERMAKVVASFPVYQYVGAAFIMAALAIIVFLNRPYWSGIAFAVAFLFLGFLFVEHISHTSIMRHHNHMQTQGPDGGSGAG